jgi:hypothetical protein
MSDFTPPTTDEALARLTMPMEHAMRTQRAVRRLHTEPVDLGLVYELLELSLKAPTRLEVRTDRHDCARTRAWRWSGEPPSLSGPSDRHGWVRRGG